MPPISAEINLPIQPQKALESSTAASRLCECHPVPREVIRSRSFIVGDQPGSSNVQNCFTNHPKDDSSHLAKDMGDADVTELDQVRRKSPSVAEQSLPAPDTIRNRWQVSQECWRHAQLPTTTPLHDGISRWRRIKRVPSLKRSQVHAPLFWRAPDSPVTAPRARPANPVEISTSKWRRRDYGCLQMVKYIPNSTRGVATVILRKRILPSQERQSDAMPRSAVQKLAMFSENRTMNNPGHR